MADIERDLASLAEEGSLFAATAADKLQQLQSELLPLAERYDIVIANPPYMGGSNMNKWISAWVKNNYANAKRDLCTCFINRGFNLSNDHGYISMITASSWMFISSFEEFRKSLLRRSSITSMIQQSTHGYAGVTVPTTMFVLAEGAQGVTGTYIRLEDFDRPQWQEPRALEALANPDCGWFYRCANASFGVIPGSPIAYWISPALRNAFKNAQDIELGFASIVKGIFTGDNERFLRFWYEVDRSSLNENWRLYAKGGAYRKWFGNVERVINWKNNANELRSFPGSGLGASKYFGKETITWTKISSGCAHFRWNDSSVYFDDASPAFVLNAPIGKSEKTVLGFLNSSFSMLCLDLLAPTLNFQCGDIKKLPYIPADKIPEAESSVSILVDQNIALAKDDWNRFETSPDFVEHPLI